MNHQTKLLLREKKAIRVALYPYKKWREFSDCREFERSEDSNRLKEFQGKYSGRRCFIIGNGPSLCNQDLNRLKDEISFAANRIYRIYDQCIWRPTFWMCVDPYIIRDDHKIIEGLPGLKFISDQCKRYGVKSDETLYMIHNHQPYYINKYSERIKVPFSSDVSKRFEAGETVTYNAIQFAAYMGFREMYLLGVDHSYSQTMDSKGKLRINKGIKDYFGDVKTEKYNIQNYTVSTNAYRSALAYGNEHGIAIYNATRGGKLDIFPRVRLEDVLE